MRTLGWSAAEVRGLEPPIISEELKAEHNAVLERVRGGGQISFATRRIRKDGAVIDLRIDTSALIDKPCPRHDHAGMTVAGLGLDVVNDGAALGWAFGSCCRSYRPRS